MLLFISVFLNSFKNGNAKSSSSFRPDAFSSVRGPLYPPSPYFSKYIPSFLLAIYCRFYFTEILYKNK